MIPIRGRSAALTAGFLGWTIFVWGIVRVRNIIGDEALSASSRNQSLLLSATFWVPAVILAVALGISSVKKSPFAPWVRIGLMGLAGWSVLVWIFRAVDIALTSDRGAAFIAVHVVLGLISIALAALVVGDLRSSVENRTPSPG